jgi:hypothetical protein
MTSEQVIKFVSLRIFHGQSLGDICEELCDYCLSPKHFSLLGCDNMTVVICALLDGASEEEWRRKITERVLQSDYVGPAVQVAGEPTKRDPRSREN